jgi:uncharacterized protein (DUF488 family)
MPRADQLRDRIRLSSRLAGNDAPDRKSAEQSRKLPREIWTIGHSNRTFDEFLELLRAPRIESIADVRRFNGSKRHPQFGREQFGPALARAGVYYHHFPDLGGRRGAARPDSPNTGWHVESFNAYADHMESPAFRMSLAKLIELAERQRVAVMCAEALPWRCHRRLIADALIVRGWTVLDIIGPGKIQAHQLTKFAEVRDDRLIYR